MDEIVPTVGSSGYYDLRSPFDSKIAYQERYTCKAVRKISDYVANNENVMSLVYTSNGLTEQDYKEDSKKDITIVSLQNGIGHWLYLPAKYINGYPIANGIAYRSLMLGVSLPPIPLNKDISNIVTDVTNLIKDILGVTPAIKLVETSRVSLIEQAKHDTLQATRDAVRNGRTTDRSRYIKLTQEYQSALDKITVLEKYIKDNHN